MKTLTAILVCFSALAIAQTPAIQKSESRNTVYGQELGKPLSIPECPVTKAFKTVLYTSFSSAEELCFEFEGETTVTPLNGKPLTNGRVRLLAPDGQLLGGTNEARVMNGKLDQLTLTTAGTLEQEHILEILVKKYGQPTEKKTNPLENDYGATWKSIDATWQLPDVKVVFFGALTLDEGKVVIGVPHTELKQLEPKL